MAFFVPEGRGTDSFRKGVKMQHSLNQDPKELSQCHVPKEGQHDHVMTKHAGIMEKSGPSLFNRNMTTSDAPPMGKRTNPEGRDGGHSEKRANLFYPYGKDAPEVKHPFQVRDPTPEQLQALMSPGAQDDKDKQRRRIEESPSRFDNQLKQARQMPFYQESNWKRELATEKAIQKGYGTKSHNLMDDVMRSDDLPGMQHSGKRVQKSSYDIHAQSVNGFRGLGSTPGNVDPFADKHPHKVQRDYTWDPLKLSERGAAPAKKPVDDLMPHQGPTQSRARAHDGVQTRALLGSPSGLSRSVNPPNNRLLSVDSTAPIDFGQKQSPPRKAYVSDQEEEMEGSARHLHHQQKVVELSRLAPSVVGMSPLPQQSAPPIVARVPEELPRATKHYPHFNVGVNEGPELIPGFQGLGSVDVNKHEIRDEIREEPHGLKRLQPTPHVSHRQFPGPTSTTKRLARGELGEGGRHMVQSPQFQNDRLPASTNSAYGGGNLHGQRAQSSMLP